jgi:hypothetical protein
VANDLLVQQHPEQKCERVVGENLVSCFVTGDLDGHGPSLPQSGARVPTPGPIRDLSRQLWIHLAAPPPLPHAEPMEPLTHRVEAAATTFLTERRGKRAHPTTLRVGALDGPHIGIPHDPSMDGGLRTDLVERILDGLDLSEALTWLTRGGRLVPGDADFAWFAASREAFGRHGCRLPAFFVITPEGWFDLVSDEIALHRSA